MHRSHELACGRRRLDATLGGAIAEGPARAFELPGARAAYVGDQPFTVEHYTIEVALDFEAKSLEGTTTLTLVARRRIDVARLAAVELDVRAVEAEEGGTWRAIV